MHDADRTGCVSHGQLDLDLDGAQVVAPPRQAVVEVEPGDELVPAGSTTPSAHARIDGQPVTPRSGYPVEIQALWVNALGTSAELLRRVRRPGDEWERLQQKAIAGFGRMFSPRPAGLPDAVDLTGAADEELRPNQLLAVSLPFAPAQDPYVIEAVVTACRAELLTSVGLRTLEPSDPRYVGHHRGTPADRDRAYHQGTVWPWLIGPYADAARRIGDDTSGLLDGLELHLAEFGLGSVSETFDGDDPHGATGCPFQAWSVAEVIRARHTDVTRRSEKW
jgi:glycogen debranching enzyme